MAGELQAVGPAPLADLPAERVDEQVRDAVVEVPARLAERTAVHVEEQLHEVRQQVVAVALAERRGKPRRPRQALGVTRVVVRPETVAVVGLVAEDAGDRLAEVPARSLAVRLVGDGDEPAHGLGIEGVEIGEPVVPRRGSGELDDEGEDHLALGEARGPLAFGNPPHAAGTVPLAACREGGHRVVVPLQLARRRDLPHHERPLAPAGILRDETARGARGPAVLVVEPREHALLPRLVGAGLDAGEPLVLAGRGCRGPHGSA